MKTSFVLLSAALAASLAACSSAPSSSAPAATPAPAVVSTPAPEPTPSPSPAPSPSLAPSPSPSPAQSLSSDLGISKAFAQSIIDTCSLVGIDDVSNSVKDSDSLVFIFYEGYQFVAISYDDPPESVSAIYESDINQHLYQNGEVVNTFSDLFATGDQMAVLAGMVGDDVSPYLKSPSTAEFPSPTFHLDEYSISRDGDTWYVSSYVDAQNSFGATVRTDFIATYIWDGDWLNSVPVFSGVSFDE